MAVITVFSLSLLGIVSLFALKAWEARRGFMVAPRLRANIDDFARACKRLSLHWEALIMQLPHVALFALRALLIRSARSFARVAHRVSEDAHTLADRVSYRHRFERRETRSDFLRKVSEGKNGTVRPLDTVN